MIPELEYAEEWLAVIGYEGLYEVSNLGRVRTVARLNVYKNGRTRYQSGVLLRPRLSNKGYLRVGLWKDGRSRGCSVHVLVAAAFVGPRPPGLTVDHKDGNKLNNLFSNLEYITPKEQISRAILLGTRDFQGEKHPGAKLSEKDVIEIRRLGIEGMTKTAIGDLFGVSRHMVGRILSGKNWKHI